MTTYKKLPVEELEARFAQARAEPSMRSVTAILRITREQVGARGFLGQYPKAAIGSGAVAVLLFGVMLFLPSELRQKMTPVSIGLVVVTAVLAYGAISGATDRRDAVKQESILRRLAADSLDEILAVPFPRKPLEREHVDTLRGLMRAFPERERLRNLLEEG